MFLDYVIAAALGATVGLAELVSRYRDEPFQAVKSFPGWCYIGLNAAASAGALLLIIVFNVDFSLTGDNLIYARVLAAGIGSMALFRSAVFLHRVGDQDVEIGPASLLKILLGVIDQSVDRVRAEERAKTVEEIMKDVSFKKGGTTLPVLVNALMQRITAEDNERIATKVSLLRDIDISDRMKSITLGLTLMDYVGADVLRSSVDVLNRDPEAAGVVDPQLAAVEKALQARQAEQRPPSDKTESGPPTSGGG